MSEIPMQARGKRPRFFPEPGTDETVSMLLELASELWVVKERLFALERAAADAGVELTDRIESWEPSEQDSLTLDEERHRMIASILRTVEARHVPGTHLRRALDREAASNREETVLLDSTANESAVRAA